MELAIHLTPTFDGKGMNFYITRDYESVFHCTIPHKQMDGIHCGMVKTLSQEHIARYLKDFVENWDVETKQELPRGPF